MTHFQWIAAILIFGIAVFGGFLPFHLKKKDARAVFEFPIGEAIACGVFLGAGLIHMLGDASCQFHASGFVYPFACLIAGVSFLGLLMLEHLGRELRDHRGEGVQLALLGCLMLSIHSFLEGAAVGLSMHFASAFILVVAIIAHKWAASFALALQINKSQLSLKWGLLCFLVFALMTPIGIFLGSWVTHATQSHPLLPAIFESLAAGTFLYIGTLHGFERATMIQRCCNLRVFFFVVLGFSAMALVAIWT